MFGRWMRLLDAWFFRLTDRQRVGVVLGTALFLFSSALYCLGIGSVLLLQRPYEVSAAVAIVVTATPELEPEELEVVEPVSFPTPLPTPTPPAGSIATPIAAVEIAEPPVVPRPSFSEPPARPRVVGPDTKPEAPSQRLPTAVATKPPIVTQPTAVPKPNIAATIAPATPTTGVLPTRTQTTRAPNAPAPTSASKQAATPPQSTAVPKAITAVPQPKPGEPTAATKAQSGPTATAR
jgi:hypothetical protein